MRPLLIFGASRGVGFELAHQEYRSGRPLYAMIRSGSHSRALKALGVHLITGDALSAHDVAHAFTQVPENCDVVSTLSGRADNGQRADDTGNINVIAAATVAGTKGRFVLVTSVGCGDMAPYRSERAIAAFGDVVDAKTRAEMYLQHESPLDWTILRPGGLLSAPPTYQGILVTDAQAHGFIHRADMADIIFRVLRDDSTSKQLFAALDATRAQSPNGLKSFALA